jgi:hypothetical protein
LLKGCRNACSSSNGANEGQRLCVIFTFKYFPNYGLPSSDFPNQRVDECFVGDCVPCGESPEILSALSLHRWSREIKREQRPTIDFRHLEKHGATRRFASCLKVS